MPIPTKPINFPDWATDAQTNPVSGQTNYVEPPSDKKTYGWEYNEIPPRQYFNWWQRVVGLWVRWIEPFVTKIRTDLDANDLTTSYLLKVTASQTVRNFKLLNNSVLDHNAVVYSEELGVTLVVSNSTNQILYNNSIEGTSWLYKNLTATKDWRSICWSPEKSLFVTISNSFCNTSPDGITWTARTVPAESWTWVIWANTLNLFVMVGGGTASTDLVATSPDGITWTRQTTPSGNWSKVFWCEKLGLLIAFSPSTSSCITSNNGLAWTSRVLPNTYYNVAYSESLGMFVAVGSTASLPGVSTDGINWTNGEAIGGSESCFSICWSPELKIFFTGVSGGEFKRQYYSYDGVNWTCSSTPQYNIWDIIWIKSLGRFIYVTQSDGFRIMGSL